MDSLQQKLISAWTKTNAIYAKAAAALGVSYPELIVLYALETMGELRQKQIAENFGLQKQTVNTVIKALSQRELVQLTPSEADKREKIIILTENGKKYAQSIVTPLRKAEDKVYKSIGAKKLRAMYEVEELINLLLEKEVTEGLTHEP